MTKKAKAPSAASEGFSIISNRKLLTLYAAMIACRGAAVASLKRPNGKAARKPGCEGAIVGATIDLRADDTIAASLWSSEMLEAVNPSVPQTSTLKTALRFSAMDKEDHRVAVLFASGRESSQISWQRALREAAELNLPVLFVFIQEVGKADVEVTQQAAANGMVPFNGRGYAFPSIHVDGSDVVAVYRVASEAITHARKGHGATQIQCLFEEGADPILKMAEYLGRKGLLDASTV
jgi:TPP-dependent pyruvate/acetoin dehydrogenase alpha subunit